MWRFLTACEKMPPPQQKTKQESYDFSFFKNIKLFLDYAFMPFPSVPDRTEFATYYSLQLVIVIC